MGNCGATDLWLGALREGSIAFALIRAMRALARASEEGR
jgi:hypothetical protein